MLKKSVALILVALLISSCSFSVFAADTNSNESITVVADSTKTEPSTYPEGAVASIPEEQSTTPEDQFEVEEEAFPTVLEIDTKNTYEMMDCAFEDGYVPQISNDIAYLVLPLISTGKIRNNEIRVSLNLGSNSLNPFEFANYEKLFYLDSVQPKNSEDEVELFLIEFPLKLSSSRINGVYPVLVNVLCYDDRGAEINYTYTVFINIEDGYSNEPTVPEPESEPEPEPITPEPVVYISCCKTLSSETVAGEDFTIELTLKNSSSTKSVKNMLLTVDTGSLQISPKENTNVFPVCDIEPSGTTTLSLQFATEASIPAGKYMMRFSFAYNSDKSLNLSSVGTTVISIKHHTDIELVRPTFAPAVTVGETIPLNLQVMNMGRDRVYNVRCEVSGFGFAPSNTGYIGTMEAGSTATTEVELYIIALNVSGGNEQGNQYGDTVGTITLLFEDESGEEYSKEIQFETTVNRPIAVTPHANTNDDEKRTTNHWWISVVILGGVICVAGFGAFLFKKKSKKRGGAYL